MRRIQNVPPFADVTAITFTGMDEGALLRGAAKFRDSLRTCLRDRSEFTVLGPAPCAVPKINYNYRYRLTLRGPMDKSLRQLLAHLLRQFAQDKANRGISAYADINAYE